VCARVCELGFFRNVTSSTELDDTPRAASPIRSSFTSIRPSLFRSSCSNSSAQRRSRSGSVPLSWQRALVVHMMTIYPHGNVTVTRGNASVKKTEDLRVQRASKQGAVGEIKPLEFRRWCEPAVCVCVCVCRYQNQEAFKIMETPLPRNPREIHLFYPISTAMF